MGCSPSKPSRRDAVELQPRHQRRQVTISSPTGGPVLVPPTYRDQSGAPIKHTPYELDHDTIQTALTDMSAFLEERGVRVELVTVGGAVNTLYLRSRLTTHDVDFFLRSATSSRYNIVHEAARFANRRKEGHLGVEWLNNATQLFLPIQLQRQLYDAALEQGTLVFESTSLRVYAAPWSYALCGKLNRLCDVDPRPYDLPDASVYLHEYLRTSDRQSVGAREIREWCKEFNKKMTDKVLEELDEAYSQSYGHRVIDWEM
ncbi:hypothetical protein E4U43_000475 [Claviceps pusilla]|uniref:Uncharacterized protein n=1 Tax=Claviceps pusilla TaxID=123648 RepID=A0A9P7N9X3_9HYPO|nr:hypothetical protein E4U43_000475 [Claviceps pusilla]